MRKRLEGPVHEEQQLLAYGFSRSILLSAALIHGWNGIRSVKTAKTQNPVLQRCTICLEGHGDLVRRLRMGLIGVILLLYRIS